MYFNQLNSINLSYDHFQEVSPARESTPAPVMEARRGLLSIMPRIIACMASLWRNVNVDEESGHVPESNTWIMGRPKVCCLPVDLKISLTFYQS